MKCWLFLVLITSSLFGATKDLKPEMLSHLATVKEIFALKYAPQQWKSSQFTFDLEKSYAQARTQVIELKSPTVKDYQMILKGFAMRFKDYHVGFQFHSTEAAKLPFTLRGVGGKFFIVHVDQSAGTLNKIAVGDEVVAINGQPIAQAVQEFRQSEVGEGSEATDMGLAELQFFHRRGDMGHVVPQGKVEIALRRAATGKLETLATQWMYCSEKIKDAAKIEFNAMIPQLSGAQGSLRNPSPAEGDFFNKMFINYSLFNPTLCLRERENGHAIGAKKGFLPALGRKVWEEEHDRNFHAYIFSIPKGNKFYNIGYLRIPHYAGCEMEALELEEILARYQLFTDALVIDQMNNPGGSAFYLFALCSMLTDKPLTLPKHRITLTQEEVHIAAHVLADAEQVKDDVSARAIFGETMGGYPVDFRFVKASEAYCRFIISEWEQGHHYSDPTHLFGFDYVHPHPRTRYTKPVLVLINNLDFSCADFFPAIIQDNKRGTLLGTRTGGAGGYVTMTKFPNKLGVNAIWITGSLAYRGDIVIENNGVTPDIVNELNIEDFTKNYKKFSDKICDTLLTLLP